MIVGKKQIMEEDRETIEFKKRLIYIYDLFGNMVKMAKDRQNTSQTKLSFRKKPINFQSSSPDMKDKQTQTRYQSQNASVQTDMSLMNSHISYSVVQDSVLTQSQQSIVIREISEIPHRSDFSEQSLSLHIHIYNFVPRKTPFLNKFRVIGQSFEYNSEDGKNTQIISNFPISTQQAQLIRFRIVRSSAMSLYVGLANTSRLQKSHSAKARDASTISFHPLGRMRFHVLTTQLQPKHRPRINNGDTIEMVVKYQRQQILWRCNGIEMDVIKVEFGTANWYPFITLKCKGDIVEVL